MAVQFRDYYETLGVPKTATEDEIRTAFRKLARKHHPDVAKDKKTAEEKFKEINEAYEVLSDPEKRTKYDQLGAGWNQPGGERSSQVEDFINTAAAMAELNSNLAELALAISSRRFSAVVGDDLLSADSADVQRQRSAEPMSKPILWSPLRKLSTDRLGPCLCVEPVQTKWKIIRSKFRAVSTRASASGWPGKANRERAGERAVICSCACDSRAIRIFRSRAAI